MAFAIKKKPILGYAFLILFLFYLVYDEMLPEKEFVTDLEMLPIFTGIASMAMLLIWMSINLFLNRKKIKYPALWGLFLFFGNWITVIIYFLFMYSPTELKFRSSNNASDKAHSIQ